MTMRTCKQCQKPFDEDLSNLRVSELREINYDFKLISDARDLNYCSKFCEKASDKTPIEVGIFRFGATNVSRKRAGDVLALTGGKGNEADIARDPVMMKHIMSGNASDKGINRSVTEMQKEKKDTARREQRMEQKQKIDTMKERYRAKYGRDTVGA